MSQNQGENQEAAQEVTVAQVYQVLTENFEKINNALQLVVHSNSLILANLIQLLDSRYVPDVGQDVVQTYLQDIDQEDLMPSPSVTSMASSSRPSTSVSSEAGTSRKTAHTTMICAECGKVFIRGSCADSITKHAKEAPCRPYGCAYCSRVFKKVSYDGFMRHFNAIEDFL